MSAALVDRPFPDRSQTPWSSQLATGAAPVRDLQRPPTQLGETSPTDKVQAAWALALRAVGYAAEQRPLGQASRCLVADAVGDPLVLRLATDYLSLTAVTDNRHDQVTALFMVENAQRDLPRLLRRKAWRNRIAAIVGRVSLGRRKVRPSGEVWAGAGL